MGEETMRGKVSIDISEYQRASQALNRELGVINSAFTAVAAGIRNMDESSEGLQASINNLTSRIDVNSQKLELQKRHYDAVAAAKGADSAAAQKLMIGINNTTAAINRDTLALGDAKAGLEKLGQAHDPVVSKADLLKQAMTSLDREVELVTLEFQKQTSGMDDWSKKSSGLKAKGNELAQTLDAQRSKADMLSKALHEMEAAGDGTEDELFELRRELLQTQAAVGATEKAIKENNKAMVSMAQAADNLKTVGSKLTGVGQSLTMGLTVPITAAGAAATKLASDLQESTNKTEVAFGDSADAVKAWSSDTLTAIGLAKGSALDAAATFGDMATGMGKSQDEAAQMSMSLVALAADLASFKNISIDQAMAALRGVFTGEGEALKTLGVIMQESTLEAYALANGYKETYKQMDQAEKVSLRYAYVMSVTKNAQGDFARTSQGTANQMRVLQESIKELGAEFGEALLPAITPIIKELSNAVQGFAELDDSTKQTIITLAGVAAVTGPAVTGIGTLITTTGSAVEMVGKLRSAIAAAGGVGPALAGLANPVGLAIAAVAALGVGVYALSMNLTEASRDAAEFGESIQESAKAFEQMNDKIDAQAEMAARLADELYDLADKESKTNVEKHRMTMLVEQLNELMPELNLSIDEQTGLLSENRKSVMDLIEAKKEEARVNALQDRLTAQYKERIEASIKLEEARIRLAEERRKEQEGEWAVWIYQLARINDAENAVKQYEQALVDIDKSIDKTIEAHGAMAGAVEASVYSVNHLDEALGSSNESMSDASEVARRMAAETAEANKELSKELMDEYAQRVKDYDEYKKALEDRTQEHIDEMGGLEDKGIKKSKLTAKQVKKNLEQQIKDFTKWREDIQALAKRVPEDVATELTALGPTQQPLIADLNKMSDEELAKWVKVWKEKSQLAADAAKDELSNLPGAAYTSGRNVSEGLADGIEQNRYKAIAAARRLANEVKDTINDALDINSPSGVTRWSGNMVGEGEALGILDMVPDVKAASDALAKAAMPQIALPGDMNQMNIMAARLQSALSAGALPALAAAAISNTYDYSSSSSTSAPISVNIYGNVKNRDDVEYMAQQFEQKVIGQLRAKGKQG